VIEIGHGVQIDEDELVFSASRSSGPGGQNVNKVSTRVTLLLDVRNSPNLSDDQKHRLADRLASRISKDGLLRVVCQQERSQHANRELAVQRLIELLNDAIRPRLRRKKTKTPRRAHEKRLDGKKRRGQIKDLRKKPL